MPDSLFSEEVRKEQAGHDKILSMDGKENAYVLHKELGEWMTDNVTVVRYNDALLKTDEKIQELWSVIKTLILMIRQDGVTKGQHLHVSLEHA